MMKKPLPLLLAIFPVLMAFASDRTEPQSVFFSTSTTDKFHVAAKPGWKLSLPQGDGLNVDDETRYIIISADKGNFEIHLYFSADPKQKFTPESMKTFMHEKLADAWDDSVEKIQEEMSFGKKIPAAKGMYIRQFSPSGRCGFASRLTDRKWQKNTPPPGQWKYHTTGICRAGQDTVLIFAAATNTVDDAQYVELLDYIASLLVPQTGDPGWKVADGAAAARIAHAEFSGIYGDLFRQRPYTVRRKNGKWIIEGNMWKWMRGGNAYMEIDGATGKILKITHYR